MEGENQCPSSVLLVKSELRLDFISQIQAVLICAIALQSVRHVSRFLILQIDID